MSNSKLGQWFVHEALAKNAGFTLANRPQGVHSFDNQNDDERSSEIIRNAITFLKLHLQLEDRHRYALAIITLITKSSP